MLLRIVNTDGAIDQRYCDFQVSICSFYLSSKINVFLKPMFAVVEACSREAVTSLPSKSDESDINTDDTPAKQRKIEYKVCIFFELVLMSLLYTG